MAKETLIRTKEEFDRLTWNRARLSQFDQSFGEDSDEGVIWGTLFGLEFRVVHQFVERALEANGFESNLENLLYGLESMRLGRRVLLGSGTRENSVQQFEPVLCMELPRRGRSGHLLAKLYGLIEALQDGKEVARHPRSSPHQVEKQDKQGFEDLSAERDSLARSLAEARAELSTLKAAYSTLLGTTADQTIGAPRDRKDSTRLETAQVRSIDQSRMKAIVRVGRRDFDIGFDELVQFPDPGAQSLVLMEQGRIAALVPIGQGWTPYTYNVVEVLAVTDQSIKIRSLNGTEWVLPKFENTRNQSPKDSTPNGPKAREDGKRGDLLVARTSGKNCLGIFPVSESDRRLSILEYSQVLVQLKSDERDLATDEPEGFR